MNKPTRAFDSFSALIVNDTRVFKAGNSLAIRIPNAIAKRMSLEDGSEIQMGLDDGLLFVRKPLAPSLDELVNRITAENVHGSAFGDLSEGERW